MVMYVFNVFVLFLALSLVFCDIFFVTNVRSATGFTAVNNVVVNAPSGNVRVIEQGLNCSEAPSRLVLASFGDSTCASEGLPSSAFFGIGYDVCYEDTFCNGIAATIDSCLSQNPATLTDYQNCYRATSPGNCSVGDSAFRFTRVNETAVFLTTYNTSTCTNATLQGTVPIGCSGFAISAFGNAGYLPSVFLEASFCCPANHYDDGVSAACVECIGTVTDPTTCVPCDSDEYFNGDACTVCPGNVTTPETCICSDGSEFDGDSCSSSGRSDSSASMLFVFF